MRSSYNLFYFVQVLMTINKNELRKICHLAQLECNETMQDSLLDDINAIMDFVEQLRTCDTNEVEPLFHPFDLHQRLREDISLEENCIEELESIAPLFEEGHYLVPKVIDN